MQIMGAEAMSNRLYRVDPKNNQRFIRASKYLKALYPELNYSQFSTVYELLTALAQSSKEKLFFVRQELHLAWVARMKTLIRSVRSPVLLLWISDHDPFFSDTGGTVFRDPLFVDRAMIEEIRREVIDIVEFTWRPEELIFKQAGNKIANESSRYREHLSAEYHGRVGAELAPIVREILDCSSIAEFSNGFIAS
jgi:hypothetical protein